jgi:aspartyl-tRNA(Asn)/glutamyl-tRNA(Gln) amidotransferase subunit A
VRNPACFCGLAGLRPTYGRVSRYGCLPLSWSQDSIGPMTRGVYDAAVMLGAMAGPDRNDHTSAPQAVPDFAADIGRDLKGIRVGVPDSFFFDDLDPEIDAALQAAIKQMEALGAVVLPVHLPASAYAGSASWTIAYSESFVFHQSWFRSRAHDYTPAFYYKIAAAGLTSAVERLVAQQVRQLVTREFAAALHEVDVIVTPASRTLASGPARGGDTGNVLRPVSLTGYPALCVPIGFAQDATPLGMQLVGRPWEEALLFRTGAAYERATGWNRRRPAPFPSEIPPPYGDLSARIRTPSPDDLVSPGWVMDMSRLLGYDFVTEADAQGIAPLLSPIKKQLQDAQRDLKLDLEPPTRPAGWY